MRFLVSLSLVTLFFAPATAVGSGFAYDKSFIVMAPTDQLATDLLASSQSCRKELAVAWFGHELADGKGETGIHLVRVSDRENRAFTWLKDSEKRTLHRIWIVSDLEGVPSLLRHEMVHVLIASEYEGRVPAWAEEGAASLEDGPERKLVRQRILTDLAQSKHGRDLSGVLNARKIGSNEQSTYAIACSLTEFLLSRSDRPTFLRFAAAGKLDGWGDAIRRYYGLESQAALQVAWREWLDSSSGNTQHAGTSVAISASPGMN